jgi:hypothetical protein
MLFQNVGRADVDLKEAVGLVQRGNAILLLGAGFSVASKNRENKPLPTGSQLATRLALDLGLPDKYPLPVIAAQFVDTKGEIALTDLLSEIFSAETITPDQERIVLMPWRRMYTLNYDNITEKVYKLRGKGLISLNYDSPVRTTDGHLQYIHLHGELNSGDAGRIR